jgi:5-methylcytosine-specific restriction enzyme subunit McrC
LLGYFSEVEASVDFKEDFLRVSFDRSMNKYKTALVWSKVFLMGNSFSAFSGSNIAFSLLFPMETLFESYIALKLRRHLRNRNYTCIVQDSTHYLFDEPKRRFLIKPDIVLRNEIGEIYILDTKWKILSNSKKNYGISQADMYQMYTYQKKYGAKSITLIYPKTDKINSVSSVTYHSKDGVTVYVNFIDLFDVENSLSHLDLFY